MEPQLKPDRRRDVILLIFSIIGILGMLGWGADLIVKGLAAIHEGRLADLPSYFLGGFSKIFCALLILPVLVFCIRKLTGQTIPPARIPVMKFWQLAILTVTWVAIILIGSILQGSISYGWAVAAPFFAAGIAVPVAAIVWVAGGGLPTGSWRRLWAVFSIGLAGSTSLSILLELLVVRGAMLAAKTITASNPEWQNILNQLQQQVTSTHDVQTMITNLAPYLANPLVFLAIAVFAAGLAPLIEETLKSAGVWLVGKRLRSPAEGFVLGALCGAGFALLEGLNNAAIGTSLLAVGVAARAVASLMHITASGLLGWAIASVRLEKRYGRLIAIYLLSFGIHATWNGSVVWMLFGSLRMMSNTLNPDPLSMLSVVGGIGLLGLTFISILALLPIVNYRLRLTHPRQSDIIAEPKL